MKKNWQRPKPAHSKKFNKNNKIGRNLPMLTKTACLVGIFIALTGCSSRKALIQPPDSDVPNNNTLSESAASVGQSLVKLAQIEQAANPTAIPEPEPNPASYGMGAQASIDWSGPIEPLVQHIAQITGYRMRTLGTAPAIPIVVTLSEKNAFIADILRDAAYQCRTRANIIVYTQSKVIEIRYAKS